MYVWPEIPGLSLQEQSTGDKLKMKQDPRTILNFDQLIHYSNPFKPLKPSIEISKFHWVPDKVDKRDYIYKLNAPKTPQSVDLRRYATPVEDQGELGSCTGNAIAECIELLNSKNQRLVEISRLFIYYYERLIMGTINYDSGAYIRDGIKATNHWGAPLETYWPYNISKFKTQPSQTAINDALKRKVTRYERATNFNACIDALTNGYPVIIGFYVYTSFMSNIVARTGMMPYPDVSKESLLGGHAVLLVGYNNSTQRFIVKNSWGTNWGDRGYFYMPYQVIQNPRMSSDFWVIKGVNNP
jgi:C1A family cysteine protease